MLPMTLGIGQGAVIDTAGHAVSLSGVLSGPGSLTKTGSGTLSLAATNTFRGTTLVTAGTLALGNPWALGQSTLDTSGSGTVSFGTLNFATLGGLTGTRGLALTNAAAATVALTVGSNGSNTTYAGALNGGGSLIKSGSGTLTLAGSNTYSGATIVNQGKLAITGSLANTDVSVGGGAALGGNGRIAGRATISGGTSPAARGILDLADGAPGTLTLSDLLSSDTALTLGGSSAGSPSALNFEVGAICDSILLTDGKLLANVGGGIINVTALPGIHTGTYDLIDFAPGQASGLDYLTLGTPTAGGFAFSLQATSTSEQLVVTAVPEPSTLVLLLAASLGLAVWAYSDRPAPVAVSELGTGVTAVAAGWSHGLALKDGGVWAWGRNDKGEVGDGTTFMCPTPERIDPADLHDITAVAAGFTSSYALSADGTLWVWGGNDYGQLGMGDTAGRLIPAHLLPPSGYRFTSISAEAQGGHAVATLAPVPEPGALALWPPPGWGWRRSLVVPPLGERSSRSGSAASRWDYDREPPGLACWWRWRLWRRSEQPNARPGLCRSLRGGTTTTASLATGRRKAASARCLSAA